MRQIQTFNRWLVGTQGPCGGVRVMAPPAPRDLLSPDEAMLLAAWLVVCAGCDMRRFRVILDAVLET